MKEGWFIFAINILMYIDEKGTIFGIKLFHSLASIIIKKNHKILRRLAVRSYGDFCIFLVYEMQGAIFLYIFLSFEKNTQKKKKVTRSKFKGVGKSQRGAFWPILAIFCQIGHGGKCFWRL